MKVFSILLIVALVIVLGARLWPALFGGETGEDFASSAKANHIEIVELPEGAGAESHTFVYTSDSTSLEIREGEIRSRVTDARVVTNVSELPDGSFVPGRDRVERVDGDGNFTFYAHAISEAEAEAGVTDFVMEDGSFMEGVYMVALDVDLENVGCSCWTRLDSEHPGTFYDPYLFGAQDLFRLCVLGKSAAGTGDDGDRGTNSIGLAFYSGYGKGDPEAPDAEFDDGGNVTNHKMSVRLKPGEKAEITLGYIVSRRWSDGVLPAPGDLFAACIGVNSIGEGDVEPAVYLGLEWPEGTEG